MNTLKLLGTLLAALLFSIGLACLISPFLSYPFFRILNRCFMVCALTGVYFFEKVSQKNPFWPAGLAKRPDTGFLIASGLTFAILSLLILTLVAYACHSVSLYFQPPKPKKLFYYTTSAILIAFFEELFFRGFLFQTLKKDCSLRASILISNLLYSAVHFIRPLLTKPEELTSVWTEAPGLFLFGIFLTYAFLKTGSLYFSMALHGGFVFFMKMDGIFVNRLMVGHWLFGEERLIGGIATWAIFLVAFPWVRWISRRRAYLPMQN